MVRVLKMRKNGIGLIISLMILLLCFTVSASATSVSDDADTGNQESTLEQEDTDLGLKNIKVDMKDVEMTDIQRKIISYFDSDFLDVPNYEFLRRYPTVFNGTQLVVWGTIVDIVSMDNQAYEMVLCMDMGSDDLEYNYDYEENYILLSGSMGNEYYMNGDTMFVTGRYSGVETVSINGFNYTMPKINVYEEYIDNYNVRGDLDRYFFKYDLDTIKPVAEAIFGKDIEIRKPIINEDISEEQYGLIESTYGDQIYYVVELEDQTNAKFSKYFFYRGGENETRINDAKGSYEAYSPIKRTIEFSADFEHYFLITQDYELATLEIEYYDRSLNKLWEREFTEVNNATYDYTKSNIYLALNNELYIINIETGEDAYVPSYVGPKLEIRKLRGGILMISENQSDGVMKVGLDGRMQWKTNLSGNVYRVNGVQFIGNNAVLQLAQDYDTHYVVINTQDGAILADVSTTEDYSYFDSSAMAGSSDVYSEGGNSGETYEGYDSGSYILADSDCRYLTNSDVQSLSLQEINYAKNEIYARHGRKFNSPELQNYFNSQPWYNGTIEPSDFPAEILNAYEAENAKFLSEVEYSLDPNGYQLDQ